MWFHHLLSVAHVACHDCFHWHSTKRAVVFFPRWLAFRSSIRLGSPGWSGLLPQDLSMRKFLYPNDDNPLSTPVTRLGWMFWDAIFSSAGSVAAGSSQQYPSLVIGVLVYSNELPLVGCLTNSVDSIFVDRVKDIGQNLLLNWLQVRPR